MTHFGTDVGTWDVVNEAIDQSQPDGYRRSPWFNIIGPDFIDIAFQAAREFAPTAKLYYQRLQHHRHDQAGVHRRRWSAA